MIAEEKRKIQDSIKVKKEEMMKKFEKLLKKGKIDRNYLYKEIMVLKGEKGLADSLPIKTDFNISKSSFSENGQYENFQTERTKQNPYLETETDDKVLSTYATVDN
jgi:hypothetical protein